MDRSERSSTARATGPSLVAGPFACFGQSWRIRADDPALVDLLSELFAPLRSAETEADEDGEPPVDFRITVPSEDHWGEVFRDGESIGAGRRPARVLGKLIWGINRQVIDHVTDRLVLHAAAAADVQGRVVLLPAPMESGKTTLVTGLLDRGLHYLTDEAAAIDADLNVHGYAKPLSIDPGSWGVLAHHRPDLGEQLNAFLDIQWQVPPHRFTEVVPSGRLALVVFPAYVPDSPTSFERLDPVTALDLARASTFGPEGRPLPSDKVARLARMASTVPCYHLRSGDLAEACTSVLDTLRALP